MPETSDFNVSEFNEYSYNEYTLDVPVPSFDNNVDDRNFFSIFWDLYWNEMLFIFYFLLAWVILDQGLHITGPRKFIVKFKDLISQRLFSVLAYYVPYIDLLNMHIPIIQRGHPFLVRLVLPNFIVYSMEFFQQIPFLSLIYLLIAYGIFVRYKIPEDRLIRFNLMSSIILMSFQGIFYELFGYYTNVCCKTPQDSAEGALVTYICWLYIFVPCFYRAVRGEYTTNAFIREAIEVHLGRDGPDFTWWDRKKRKPKRPRKPKK